MIISKSGTIQSQLKIIKYKHGGVATSNAKDGFLDKTVKRYWESHMVAVRDGERILTLEQNKIYEEMIEFAKSHVNILASILNRDYSSIKNVNSSPTPIVQEITLNLPNVTNQNAAKTAKRITPQKYLLP